MKVLLDANILIDICGQTEDLSSSFQALDIMLLREDEPCMLTCMAPTVCYVVRSRGYASEDAALSVLDRLTRIVPMADVIPADYADAVTLKMADFEDALLASAAKRHEADLILTRNVKDFKASPVRAIHPDGFIAQFCPPGYEYGEVAMP